MGVYSPDLVFKYWLEKFFEYAMPTMGFLIAGFLVALLLNWLYKLFSDI